VATGRGAFCSTLSRPRGAVFSFVGLFSLLFLPLLLLHGRPDVTSTKTLESSAGCPPFPSVRPVRSSTAYASLPFLLHFSLFYYSIASNVFSPLLSAIIHVATSHRIGRDTAGVSPDPARPDSYFRFRLLFALPLTLHYLSPLSSPPPRSFDFPGIGWRAATKKLRHCGSPSLLFFLFLPSMIFISHPPLPSHGFCLPAKTPQLRKSRKSPQVATPALNLFFCYRSLVRPFPTFSPSATG